ncbi:MAG: TRAP transporter large permease [Rectinema subterraneum]|uniref:TRAP transporter large permease n=1 Tax=Rectinema subterraneum TaxID=2653714 RepID=UPI003C7E662E
MFILFLVGFIVLLCLGLPIALGLGGAAFLYFIPNGFFAQLVQNTYAGIGSYTLLAVPLFMLAGNLMNESGITEHLANFTMDLLGHIRGGLGMATILASGIFAAITGSAVATAVAIGGVLIPVMHKAGYEDEVSASVTATAACLGPIIPPSIPFIIYGVIANVSISALFLAGIVPGIIFALSLMIYMYFVAKKRNYPVQKRTNLKEIAIATWKALPAIFMPVIILGGILGGIFTPTEAASVAVIYAFLIDRIIYHKITMKKLYKILLISGLETGTIMLLLGLSEPFAWVVAVEQIPQAMIGFLSQTHVTPMIALLLINIGLLILGIPLETAPALTIVVPILAPMAAKLGINPIHLGIIVCFNLVLGLITPPVGGVLFSVCGISGLPLEKLSKAIWPPFLISVIVLLIITYLPALSTFLPSLLLH